ncbi:MAG: hypothetical protein J0M03_20915 [Acidobacteria bacterium]|nr:hypothetical protein [Acidobacteriota bacterium]
MLSLEAKLNAEAIQKRCFDLLVWTLQHFTPKLQHFFLTQQRSFNPLSDKIQFWDTGYQTNSNTKECAEKIKKNIYLYWQENYKNVDNNHQALIELASKILDPTSDLCKLLEIGDGVGSEENLGFHLELIGGAVGYIISAEALLISSSHRKTPFSFQALLDIANLNKNNNPNQYKQIKYSNLIALLNYTVQNNLITAENLHIYLAEYLYARLSSFSKILPSAFIPILLPLRGLAQWRAMAGWICPKNKQLKEHLRLVRKSPPESLILAIEEIYSINLIDVFIFLLEDAISKHTDALERMKNVANVFSHLWIAEEILFFRENSLALHFSVEKKENNLASLPISESSTEKSKLLIIEEDSNSTATIIFNLNRHKDAYLLKKAFGFDLVIYRNCPGVKLNLPGQEEYWEAQFREKLSRTAAIIIKEQYFLTQGLTHEIMNTLSRRSRYRVLYAKSLNNEPIEKAEVLYTCAVLQELYHLTDAIRTVTKFDNPKTYLLKLINNTNAFNLQEFADLWRKTIQEIIQHLLFSLINSSSIAIIFHKAECSKSNDCLCPKLEQNSNLAEIPVFPPFSIEATSLFLVGIHEILGNAIQYLVKQLEQNKKFFLKSKDLINYIIDIKFSLILEEDEFYELLISNPVAGDEKPTELSDGLKRTQNLLSCFVFRNDKGEEKKLVEFLLVDKSPSNYHSIAIRFRPQLVFQK